MSELMKAPLLKYIPIYSRTIRNITKGAGGLVALSYFNIVLRTKDFRKDRRLISISKAIKKGFDDSDMKVYKKFNYSSTLLLMSLVSLMIINENLALVVYTTDFTSRIDPKFNFTLFIILANIISTISWIIALSITLNTEGDLTHYVPAFIFFVSSTVLRLIFLKNKKGLSKMEVNVRNIFGVLTTVSFIIGYVLGRKDESKGDNLVAIAEIIAIFLIFLDRLDLSEALIEYHSPSATK